MRFVLPALALSLVATSANAQRRADSVSLRFKWPTGTTAHVEQEWIRVQSSPERRDSVSITSRYRMRVLDHAEGQLIAADSFSVLGTSGFPTGSNQADAQLNAQQLLTTLGSFQPSFVVNGEGEFRRVEGIAQMKQLLDSLMAPILRELKEVPADMQTFLQNATSEQALAAAAAQEWNAVVGTWAGADWIVGEAYETTIEEPVPIVPGLKIPMRYEFGAAERVACTPAMRKGSCVRLELYSEPDTVALRKFMADFMARLGPSGKEVVDAMQNLRTANEITLVAEPLTLRPYSVTRVKRVEASVAAGPNEKGGTTTRVDTRIARYRYVR